MQTIETRVIPASNTKPTRIVANNTGGARLAMSVWKAEEISGDTSGRQDNLHAVVAKALAQKLDWHGKMYGGGTKRGMVWVFEDAKTCFEVQS